MSEEKKYPDQYLCVREKRSGQEWIMPITGSQPQDLTELFQTWVEGEFSGELDLDSEPQRVGGDYWASIITDGRPPDSVAVWDSGGFYLKSTYE